jgi:hypothetical protein
MYPITLTFADLAKGINAEYTIAKRSNQIALSWNQEGSSKQTKNDAYTSALTDEESALLDTLQFVFSNVMPLSEYTAVTNFTNKNLLVQKLALDALFRIVETREEIISLNEVIENAYVER